MRPGKDKPSAAALQRARVKLDRAEKAYAELEAEEAAILQRHADEMRRFEEQVEDIKGRVLHHRGRVEDIEAEIGAGRGLPPLSKKKMLKAGQLFEDLSPQVYALVDILEKLPGAEQARSVLAGIQGGLANTFQTMADAAPGLLGQDQTADDADDDDSYPEEDSEDSDESFDDDEDDEPELLEEVNPPNVARAETGADHGEQAVVPNSAASGSAWHGGGAAAAGTQAAATPAHDGGLAAPRPEGDDGDHDGGKEWTMAKSSKKSAGRGRLEGSKVGKKTGTSLAEAGTAIRDRVHQKLKEGLIRQRKNPPTTGGATAPCLVPMADTSVDAQNLPPIMDESSQ